MSDNMALETLLASAYGGKSSGGGGGGGGTTNYNALTSKPKINGVTLTGDKSTADLELFDNLTPEQMAQIKGEKGAKGDTGEKGEDGYSPTVTITDIPGGHRVTITDEEHPTGQAFDVMDGQGGVPDEDTFVAEYGVTTAQEIIAYIDSTNEPFAPILVKRGNTYYTAVISTPGTDRVNLSTFGTISGEGYLFNYTVTGSNWSSSNIGFQTKLASGTNIKTINGESLLGSGNIDIQGGGSITVDDSLSEESINPVQNRVIHGALESMRTAMVGYLERVTALETKLKDYQETVLTMTDGTNMVDKLILSKPHHTYMDVFDWHKTKDGAYDADYNWLGSLSGYETYDGDTEPIPEDVDYAYQIMESENNDYYIVAVFMDRIITKYPTIRGLRLNGSTVEANAFKNTASDQLDWLCLLLTGPYNYQQDHPVAIVSPLSDVEDFVSTIYVTDKYSSEWTGYNVTDGAPWGTTATIDTTGLIQLT